MALTDTFVKKVRHTGKPAGDKHADAGGLYLLVKLGGRYWRMDYRFAGKRKTLALGIYPTVSLAVARERRDAARKLLADSVDPGIAKQQGKLALVAESANSFEATAREFFKAQSSGWSLKYAAAWIARMEKDLFPYLGKLPMVDINAPVLLTVLRRVEKRGAIETAHSLRQPAGQVFRYGIQTGRCERSPAADLHGALKPVRVKHMAAVLEPAKVAKLMRAIDGYSGQPVTRGALVLSALLFQRDGDLAVVGEQAHVDGAEPLDADRRAVAVMGAFGDRSGRVGRPDQSGAARRAQAQPSVLPAFDYNRRYRDILQEFLRVPTDELAGRVRLVRAASGFARRREDCLGNSRL